MSKYIVCLFGAFLSLTCHTSRGVMLRGSGEALQRPSVINSESQFDVEKSLVQLKGDTEKLSSNNKKSFLHKNEEEEESYLQLSKKEEENLEKALEILLELDKPGTIGTPRDWREALEELARTNDKAAMCVGAFKNCDEEMVRDYTVEGEDYQGGPTAKKLTAILRGLRGDIQQIVEQKKKKREAKHLFEETAGKVKYDDKKKRQRVLIGTEHQKNRMPVTRRPDIK